MRLWLNPDQVDFDGHVLEHVCSVRLRRISVPEGLVLQQVLGSGPRGDGGFQGIEPVAGELVTIEIVRDIVRGLTSDLATGASGTLSFEIATERSDAHRDRLQFDVTVTEIDARLVRDDRGIEVLRFADRG